MAAKGRETRKKTAYKLPQPDQITTREREDAMGAYLMMFAAAGVGLPLPFLSLIASIIYYYLNKKASNFVAFHAWQSLITQTPISFITAAMVIWFIRLLIMDFHNWQPFVVYAIFTLVMNLIYAVFSIIGAVRARKGLFYYFLFFGQMSYSKFYGSGARKKEERRKRKNLPPRGY